ncbi:uncharacterized protein LOC129760965, partial [Uranotaenia lowii]|uniref:uncharacterized protein LOC129760965 n=1 Tax=Uranotaenia lowii TaxID=190385 RepID=UPI00247B0637
YTTFLTDKKPFQPQNASEPVPVINMEIAPKKLSEEVGDGDHKPRDPSPKILKPLATPDPTPAVTPARTIRPKKRNPIAKVQEEADQDENEINGKMNEHHYDESFCKQFNQYALQQEAEFEAAIEDELSRLENDANKLYISKSQEVSYEDDYEPDSSPEKMCGKMADIFDHKVHINELEEQIRNLGGPLMNGSSKKHHKTSVVKKSSSSSSDPDSSPNASRDSTTSRELESMKREIRENIMKKECLLDTFCDEINGKDSTPNKSNRLKDNPKRSQIDPRKKKNLLEALKAIDGDSYEKS